MFIFHLKCKNCLTSSIFLLDIAAMANSLKANVTLKAEKEIREEKEGAKEMDDTLDEPAEDEEERKARAAAEEAAARERAAQRQLMVIEELVQTERNYLKHLQLCTVTIHSNLQKLQVDKFSSSHFQTSHSLNCSKSTYLSGTVTRVFHKTNSFLCFTRIASITTEIPLKRSEIILILI